MPERSTSGPGDYLAAERTFLAWIRTGLALMGFGFVVARFGLFLEALQGVHLNDQARAFGLSFWFGTGLILLGVVVNVFCVWSHFRLVRELQRGGPAAHRPSILATAVATILAALGLAMAIYLISVHDPSPARPRSGGGFPGRPNAFYGYYETCPIPGGAIEVRSEHPHLELVFRPKPL
jgi:putative membrane protein